MAVIEFKDVQYKSILKGISGTFREGKITTLVGPSGAGKTTCLKQINGLLSPDAGAIYFKGTDLKDIDMMELRKKIGMAFQSAPMIAGTVYDNLNLPKAIFDQTLGQEEAKRLLERVDLKEVPLTQNVKELSGGEKSRIAIARTLVNRPDVLLLDEITASLDYRMVKEIEALVRKVQREFNMTVIWITHDLEQARRVSDDMWFLKDGQLIQQGTIELIEGSDNPVIEAFVKGVDQ